MAQGLMNFQKESEKGALSVDGLVRKMESQRLFKDIGTKPRTFFAHIVLHEGNLKLHCVGEREDV